MPNEKPPKEKDKQDAEVAVEPAPPVFVHIEEPGEIVRRQIDMLAVEYGAVDDSESKWARARAEGALEALKRLRETLPT